MIGGTSAGGVIATQYASGMDPDTMEARNREAFVKNRPFHDLHVPIVSILGSRKMDRLARWMYGPDTRIEDLWLPCFCVSTDLSASVRVVHRSGVVWKAVRASSALPGISVPVVHENRLLVDGGVMDNLPGPALHELSGGPVIVVDVSPDEPLVVRYDEIPRGSRILWSWIVPFRKRIEVPTMGHVILRTAIISSVAARRQARASAVLMLRPPVERFNLLEFAAFDDIVRTGHDYALRALADWPERARYALDSLPPEGAEPGPR
jgi:predicted acylesterase/phospholipase RssA